MASFLLGAIKHRLDHRPHGRFHYPLPSVRDAQTGVPRVLAYEWWDQDPNLALSASVFHILLGTLLLCLQAPGGWPFTDRTHQMPIALLFY